MPQRNHAGLCLASSAKWLLDNQQLSGQGLRWSEAAIIWINCSLEKRFGAESIKRTTSDITSCQERPRCFASARYPQRPSPVTSNRWNASPQNDPLPGRRLGSSRLACGPRKVPFAKGLACSGGLLWGSLHRERQNSEDTGEAASGRRFSESCRATGAKGEQLLQNASRRYEQTCFSTGRKHADGPIKSCIFGSS